MMPACNGKSLRQDEFRSVAQSGHHRIAPSAGADEARFSPSGRGRLYGEKHESYRFRA
jgi:hypothetical protein